MEIARLSQNYQNAMKYERFMKAAYRCTQRCEQRGIWSAEFHLLYHIQNGNRYPDFTFESQLKRVQHFVLSAMYHVETTRLIPEHILPFWESLKLDVEYSNEADYLSIKIDEIRNIMKDFSDIGN